MEVPRLGAKRRGVSSTYIIDGRTERAHILDFALFQVVHVDVDSICSPHGQLSWS